FALHNHSHNLSTIMDSDSSIITDPESSLVIDDYNEIYDVLPSPELETNFD
ncbi:23303_t:CDS:1, partial [Dentiscutata erythropus]